MSDNNRTEEGAHIRFAERIRSKYGAVPRSRYAAPLLPLVWLLVPRPDPVSGKPVMVHSTVHHAPVTTIYHLHAAASPSGGTIGGSPPTSAHSDAGTASASRGTSGGSAAHAVVAGRLAVPARFSLPHEPMTVMGMQLGGGGGGFAGPIRHIPMHAASVPHMPAYVQAIAGFKGNAGVEPQSEREGGPSLVMGMGLKKHAAFVPGASASEGAADAEAADKILARKRTQAAAWPAVDAPELVVKQAATAFTAAATPESGGGTGVAAPNAGRSHEPPPVPEGPAARAPLPLQPAEIERISDRVYEEIERRLKIEKQRMGL